MMLEGADFLECADRIGARLCRDALWSGDRCTWTGPVMIPDRGEWRVVERTCGPDLYQGTAGIGCVLARLARLTGERIYERTAEGAMAQAFALRESVARRHRGGLHGGWSGIALAARAASSGTGRRGVAELLNGIPGDGDIDVMAGSAGAILGLVTEQSERAVEHGRRLVEEAVPQARGVAWRTRGEAPAELAGMAHGASGIGWALLELWHATGDESFREYARGALEYERLLFDTTQQNWRDLRAPAPACAVTWCNGSAGIGLVRLRFAELDPDPRLDEEIAAAERATARSFVDGGNFCLCHGQAGNADLWIEGAVRRGESDWLERAREIGVRGIELYEEPGNPWPCGVTGGGETPGLMLGLAGIAWFYLRLHDPVAHRSVLLPVPGEWAAV